MCVSSDRAEIYTLLIAVSMVDSDTLFSAKAYDGSVILLGERMRHVISAARTREGAAPFLRS